jgi:hypothetical protein
MIHKTLLGTLVRIQPHYMNLLMKPHQYEEFFKMNEDWIGLLEFKKKTGTPKDVYDKYISSLITIQDENNMYQEHIEYFLVPSAAMPVLLHPTWRKNKVKIPSREIPSIIFQLLKAKHRSNIVYSSHPV